MVGMLVQGVGESVPEESIDVRVVEERPLVATWRKHRVQSYQTESPAARTLASSEIVQLSTFLARHVLTCRWAAGDSRHQRFLQPQDLGELRRGA